LSVLAAFDACPLLSLVIVAQLLRAAVAVLCDGAPAGSGRQMR
jgi:hypothetical protein